MKRQTRKFKKLPILWTDAVKLEVPIRRARRIPVEPALPENIIVLPLSDTTFYYPPPPPLAA